MGLVDGKLPLLEDGEKLVELGAVPREDNHGSTGLELWWLEQREDKDGRRERDTSYISHIYTYSSTCH